MKIEDIVKEVTPAGMDNLMINKDDFMELFKKDKVVLVKQECGYIRTRTCKRHNNIINITMSICI